MKTRVDSECTWIGGEKRATTTVAVTVCVPAGVSLSSSVQRWTKSANMPRPRAVLCSCKTDRTSPSSPDKQRQGLKIYLLNKEKVQIQDCIHVYKKKTKQNVVHVKALKQFLLCNDNKGMFGDVQFYLCCGYCVWWTCWWWWSAAGVCCPVGKGHAAAASWTPAEHGLPHQGRIPCWIIRHRAQDTEKQAKRHRQFILD